MKLPILLLVLIFSIVLSAEEFTGTVERFKTGDLGFENQGRIIDIKRIGLSVNSIVYDEKNNIVSSGDIIATQDTSLCEAAVSVSDAELKQALAELREKQLDFERSKQLKEKNALSQKQLDSAEKEYNMAVASQKRAEASCRSAKYNLEACFLRAPFDGEIEAQLASEGTWVDQGIPVVTLTVFSFMKIVLDVPEKFTRKVSLTNKINVISPLDGKLIQPAWFNDCSSDSKRITILVKNKKVPVYQLADDEKNIPAVDSVSFVISKDGDDFKKTIWIPENSIFEDENGSFIWLAKEQNMKEKINIIDRKFAVEKKYLKSLDKFKNLGINTFRCVENPGNIKLYDIILLNPPADLKDGSKVIYQPSRWLLRPGDQVKVIIE
jgi:RND family efflux transporter MFP subunit